MQKLKRKEELHNMRCDAVPERKRSYYSDDSGRMIVRIINYIRDKVVRSEEVHANQYMLKKGLSIFGKEKGKAAAKSEFSQLVRRTCFKAMAVAELTKREKEQAMIGLMILQQKKDGSIKGRYAYNGKPTRSWASREDKSSPTA